MSFCLDVKEEISKVNTYSNQLLLKLELIGGIFSNSEDIDDYTIFTSEYFTVIKRFYSILNKLYNFDDFNETALKKSKNYSLKIRRDIFDINEQYQVLESTSDIKEIGAIFRGAFLLGGTISAPSKEYHLDILVNELEIAELFCNMALFCEIDFKISQRKDKYVIYLKEASSIADFLVLIGAENAMLKFEEERVIKDVRNNINRNVNCETANLNKTIDASIKMINDIKYIKSKRKFDKMPDNLKEIASLRLKQPNASLKELASMLEKKVTKSGVKHRLDAISKYAEELRNNK